MDKEDERTSATEKCIRCNRVLPISAFVKTARKKNGLYSYCRKCSSDKRKMNYLKKKTTEAYKARHRNNVAKYIRNHPLRAKAHGIARRNKDKLIKEACEGCGATENLHMHHPDYSKPLEVLTLCLPCHEDVHHGVKI